MVASSDFSASQFFFAVCDANGQAALAAAAGVPVVGTVQNKPSLNQPATIRPFGISKCVAGAAIAKGALVATDATGRAKAASALVAASGAGSNVVGIALDDATAAGQVFSLLILQLGLTPTTAA